MKKTLTLIACLIAFIARPQEIPNSGFENWNNNTSWNDPIPMTTSNYFSFFGGFTGSVIRSTNSHGGSYAALLQTESSYIFGTTPGMLGIGLDQFFNQGTPVPFVGSPDSLVVWVNSSIVSGDAGNIAVTLYSGNIGVADASFNVEGTSEGYIRLSAPFEYVQDLLPDGMVFFATNSNFNNPNSGSTLYIDDIELVYLDGEGDGIAGGDFENWSEATLEEPDSWNTSNMFSFPEISVSKDVNAYEGDFCLKLENKFSELIGSNIGLLYLGDLYADECDEQSLVVADGSYPTSCSGYYKYEAVDLSDSASVYILLRYYDEKTMQCDSLYEAIVYLPVASEWTPFSYEIPESVVQGWANNHAPDYFTLGFAPAEIPMDETSQLSGTIGNIMWLDQLDIEYTISESVNNTEIADRLIVYPNPAHDFIQLNIGQTHKQKQAFVYDYSGKQVINTNLTSENNRLDISQLAPGTYFIKVISDHGVSTQSFLVVE